MRGPVIGFGHGSARAAQNYVDQGRNNQPEGIIRPSIAGLLAPGKRGAACDHSGNKEQPANEYVAGGQMRQVVNRDTEQPDDPEQRDLRTDESHDGNEQQNIQQPLGNRKPGPKRAAQQRKGEVVPEFVRQTPQGTIRAERRNINPLKKSVIPDQDGNTQPIENGRV